MKKILIIEDDLNVRENIFQLLSKVGYDVTAAVDGFEGIDKAINMFPDLILCDVMMPGIDGYDVLRRLANEPATAMIPFIFLTAKTEMSDLRDGMDLGADDYLTKPFKAGTLLKAIESRLAKRERFSPGPADPPSASAPPSQALASLQTGQFIMVGNPPQILKTTAILYVQAQAGYSYVFTADGKKMLVRKLLKEWETILPGEAFIRIHNSTIVNLEYIESVQKWFNYSYRLVLRGLSEPLEVSKRYSAKVKARLKV